VHRIRQLVTSARTVGVPVVFIRELHNPSLVDLGREATLLIFRLLPAGFRSRQRRTLLAELLGKAPDQSASTCNATSSRRPAPAARKQLLWMRTVCHECRGHGFYPRSYAARHGAYLGAMTLPRACRRTGLMSGERCGVPLPHQVAG
jgi:hypothetical protein